MSGGASRTRSGREPIQMDEPVQVVVRMPKALLRLIDHDAIDHDEYRTEAMIRLLTQALETPHDHP